MNGRQIAGTGAAWRFTVEAIAGANEFIISDVDLGVAGKGLGRPRGRALFLQK